MFNKLFARPVTIVRHQTAPLAKERLAYLNHLAGQGSPFGSLCQTAPYLLMITDRLCLYKSPDRVISVAEIKQAADWWAKRRKNGRYHKPGACSKGRFISIVTRWLEFIGRLKQQSEPESRFEPWLIEFDDYMRNERGLSTVTRSGRHWFINRFLGRTVAPGGSQISLTIADVDRYFQTLGNQARGSAFSI